MDITTAARTITLAADFAAIAGESRSSAELCLADARACFAKADYEHANSRALASLSYSVGCLHWAWREAVDALVEKPEPQLNWHARQALG